MTIAPRSRPLASIALTGAATVVLLCAGTGAASAAPDQPGDTPPARSHRIIFPTREAVTALPHVRNLTTPDAVTVGSGQLSYGGGVDGIGVTTGPPKVYLIFWGSQWGTASTSAGGVVTLSGDSAGMAPRLQSLFAGIGTNNETWSGVMTQYCEGVATGTKTCPASAAHVGYPSGGALAGVWADGAAASPSAATGHQLAVEAVAAAAHFGNTTAASNRNAQYVVVSPTGMHPDGFNTSSGNFCAWHDYNGDTTLPGGAASSSYGDIAFTNLPYLTDAGTSCGRNYVNSGSAGTLDGVSIVEGHEYAETITDQNPAGGWTDTTGYENADKCAWVGVGGTGGAQNVSFANGSFAMQSTWSNDATGCQISHPIVGGGSTGNTVTVTGPGTQTTTVGTTVSLQVQAASSAGGSLTYSASGLPAGLSINASTGLISGITATAGTSSVTVTATDGTGAFGSATFGWTVTPVGGTCSAPGQVLGNPGFESGSGVSWTASSGVISSATAANAHGGSWYAKLDGTGAALTQSLSQSVTVPSGCSSYPLTFWLKITTAETTKSTAYDKLTVKVAAGGTTSTLATYSNLNAGGYTQKSFDLSAYAGRTVTLTFTGSEDYSLQTTFLIDDTALTVG